MYFEKLKYIKAIIFIAYQFHYPSESKVLGKLRVWKVNVSQGSYDNENYVSWMIFRYRMLGRENTGPDDTNEETGV